MDVKKILDANISNSLCYLSFNLSYYSALFLSKSRNPVLSISILVPFFWPSSVEWMTGYDNETVLRKMFNT